jgi:hypothetical protein
MVIGRNAGPPLFSLARFAGMGRYFFFFNPAATCFILL